MIKGTLRSINSNPLLGRFFNKKRSFPTDMDPEFREIYLKCKPYTMTPIERMYSLYKAVEHIVDAKIPGDFVECGVWKGGSTMVIALTLLKKGESGRKIYLYDTYEGMSKPTEADITIDKRIIADKTWERKKRRNYNMWCYASLEEVRKNMKSTNYPPEDLIFIKGKVEDTIPKTIPSSISLLRLDTDWYESTLHELKHLYPLLNNKGIVIIDDYGCWKGAKKATDEYFTGKEPILLTRTDEKGGRIGIK